MGRYTNLHREHQQNIPYTEWQLRKIRPRSKTADTSAGKTLKSAHRTKIMSYYYQIIIIRRYTSVLPKITSTRTTNIRTPHQKQRKVLSKFSKGLRHNPRYFRPGHCAGWVYLDPPHLKVNSPFSVPQHRWFSVIEMPALNLCNSKPHSLKIKLTGAKAGNKGYF